VSEDAYPRFSKSFAKWLDQVAPDKRQAALNAVDNWLSISTDYRSLEEAIAAALGEHLWTAWKAYNRITR
jgi:hypothetical protein